MIAALWIRIRYGHRCCRAVLEVSWYLVLVPVKIGIVEANGGRTMSYAGDIDDRCTISMPLSVGRASADQFLKSNWSKNPVADWDSTPSSVGIF